LTYPPKAKKMGTSINTLIRFKSAKLAF